MIIRTELFTTHRHGDLTAQTSQFGHSRAFNTAQLGRLSLERLAARNCTGTTSSISALLSQSQVSLCIRHALLVDSSICERRELSQGQASPAREKSSARPPLRARPMTSSAWTEVLKAELWRSRTRKYSPQTVHCFSTDNHHCAPSWCRYLSPH